MLIALLIVLCNAVIPGSADRVGSVAHSVADAVVFDCVDSFDRVAHSATAASVLHCVPACDDNVVHS